MISLRDFGIQAFRRFQKGVTLFCFHYGQSLILQAHPVCMRVPICLSVKTIRSDSIEVIFLMSPRRLDGIRLRRILFLIVIHVKASRKNPLHRQNTALMFALIHAVTDEGVVEATAIVRIVICWNVRVSLRRFRGVCHCVIKRGGQVKR